MKIKYKIGDKNFKAYREAHYITNKKDKIIGNPNNSIFDINLTELIAVTLALVLCCASIINEIIKDNVFFQVYLLFFAVCLIIFGIAHLSNRYGYKTIKQHLRKGEISFDKKGIVDTNDNGLTISVDWSKIKCCVANRYAVTIITDTIWTFYLSINYKDDVIKAIKKYSPELLIIDKTEK